ncbi:MAG: hypothetical protein LBR60_00090 [Fibrobacter sp.]|nr:hypothetical protein [Fibrobacter sp.]
MEAIKKGCLEFICLPGIAQPVSPSPNPRNNLYRLFSLFFTVCLCVSCSVPGVQIKIRSERTVLVYMAADNNLSRNAEKDILEMRSVTFSNEYNLIVYMDTPNQKPCLLKIQNGSIDTLKIYEPQNSASKQVLESVIDESFALFSAEHYGLVLWSHGTGWLPSGKFDELKNPVLRSFGRDNGKEMEITDLAEALPDYLEFLIFDACLMSGIEILYQLRHKAGVIIASPTESLAAGFPYDSVLPFLFLPQPKYNEAAQSYMDYFKDKTGALQSASITVIDTKELEPLAVLVRENIQKESGLICPDREQIQRYDTKEPALFFDFEDYLKQLGFNMNSIRRQLNKVVLFKDFTLRFLQEFELEKVSGVGVYISVENDLLFNEYRDLDWFLDTGLFCERGVPASAPY